MAVDIGRALSGLGAAFKNEMPAFIQQTRQEDALALQQEDREMALTERRKKTMFQDMAAAKILFDAGDYRGIADLMEDRVNLLRNTDADTSHSRNYGSLAVRAAAGDPQAISELGGGIQNGVAVGYATGMIPMPVDTSTTLKEGDVIYNRDGSIRFDNRVVPEPKQGKDERGVLRYETGPKAGQPVYGSGASSVPTSGVLPSSIPAAIRRPNLQTVEERERYADLSPFDRDRLMREDALAEQADADRLAGLERDRLSDERLTSSLIIPDVLIADLDEDVAALAAAAYRGGNGGSSGMAAASKVIEDSRELSRMENMAVSLSEIFPSAAGADMEELQSIVRNAESYESGLSLAQTRRESQKTDSAGRENKIRGIELIDRILANKELNSVLGSYQGGHQLGDWAVRDRFETDAIVDIKNLEDILTGDNLGMMTGVLSESDMRVIANIAGGGLNRYRSEELFRADIQDIRDRLAADFNPRSAPVVTSATVTPRTSTGTPTLQSQADSIIRGDG